ncbi:hypothetical protein WHZ78_02450 [Bradyrhizobium symbiodeficiens]|uniref:hypothetical protein n=1 Tax=Bradyrhizobium symbiodeficiens TaxID=1404367 RepID=UPI0030CD1130
MQKLDELPINQLVPDPIVAREFCVTLMTLWRWTRDAELGFPPAVKIRGKNFRARAEIEAFKDRLLKGGLRERYDSRVAQSF